MEKIKRGSFRSKAKGVVPGLIVGSIITAILSVLIITSVDSAQDYLGLVSLDEHQAITSDLQATIDDTQEQADVLRTSLDASLTKIVELCAPRSMAIVGQFSIPMVREVITVERAVFHTRTQGLVMDQDGNAALWMEQGVLDTSRMMRATYVDRFADVIYIRPITLTHPDC